MSRDVAPGRRPPDPYCVRVTLHYDLIKTVNNFRFLYLFPQVCRVVHAWCLYCNTNRYFPCYTDGRKSPSLPEIERGWSETTEMARSCGHPPRLREDAIPTMKWKKQPSLETATPSLPSYQHMYTDNLSGESNTCCHCPTVTTRAPENNYLLSTKVSTN